MPKKSKLTFSYIFLKFMFYPNHLWANNGQDKVEEL